MATYVVDVDDSTTPTNSQGAKQGAEELRAIKGKLLSIAVANTAGVSVRNAIQSASIDANGYNNALSIGAGLRVSLAATAVPYQLSYASGFIGGKTSNQEESILVDNPDILGVDLPLNNTSYLLRTFGTGYRTTLVPKQEGYIFDRTKQALLNFEGINGAVTTTDDFGNTWLLTGSSLATAQFKFGTSSLNLTGGAGRYTRCGNILSLGDGSWELSMWFRLNSLPGVGTSAFLLRAGNAGGWGVTLALINIAGVTKLGVNLSSNGTADDITASLGANTVWALNQWNKVRLVFDALAGTYRTYLSLNAVLETQDFTVSSAARICSIVVVDIGYNVFIGASQLDGWIDAFRFIPCATKTTVEVPVAVAPTVIDYTINFFSIPKMEIYEVTVASAVAGTNPTLTKTSTVFLGEADTSGVAVTAVRNYAIRSEFTGQWGSIPAISTNVSNNHNIGSEFIRGELQLRNVMAEQNYTVGHLVQNPSTRNNDGFDGNIPITITKKTIEYTTGGAVKMLLLNRTTGAVFDITTANWQQRLTAKRIF